MAALPEERTIDASPALLREGYEFIPRRCRRFGSDAFLTRMMLQQVVCMTGPEAAAQFYVPGRFTRRRALPPTVLTLLQDFGSAQVLDGEAHHHRKRMFLGFTSPGSFDRLVELVEAELHAGAERWQRRAAVVFEHAAREVLCRAVCTWAGVPVEEKEVHRRTLEFASMFEGAGAIGPRQWRGQLLRSRNERWMRGIVDGIRSGRLEVPEGSPAHAIAWHRELDGSLLDTASAAVELINVLRPTVAVARYFTFVALALHEHPDERRRVAEGGDEEAERFVQEVRRLSPFFPLVGGRVTEPFEWRDHRFGDGDWVMLDVYGTNRDSRAWEAPDEFRPERFDGWEGDPFTLVPQGGGDHQLDHRCAGEWITIALMKVAARFLTEAIEYDVPAQDLSVSLSRMPAIPASGFVMSGVRPAP